MMRKIATWKAMALAVAVLSAVACGAPGPAGEQAAPVELRTYEVPEGYKSEITGQLRYVLQGSEESAVGRVVEGAGSSLIVVAPPGIHEGLQTLVRDLQDLGPVPAPSQVRLTYWLVVGWPATTSATSDRSFLVTGPAGLGQIEPVLAGIAEAQEPTEFRLLERIEIVSTGHDWARARGRVAEVAQRTAVSGETAVANLNVSLGGRQSLATEVLIQRGQHLVLGQALATDELLRSFGEAWGANVTLYYVVAADF